MDASEMRAMLERAVREAIDGYPVAKADATSKGLVVVHEGALRVLVAAARVLLEQMEPVLTPEQRRLRELLTPPWPRGKPSSFREF